MWPQLGTPFGFILANGFMLLLTVTMGFTSLAAGDTIDHNFLVWGWRIPFIASIVMVALGLYVRFKLEETPIFKQALEKDEKVKAPLAEAFRVAWWPMIQGTFIMLATYVLFYLMTAWILSFGIGAVEKGGLGIAYREFLVIQLITILFFAAMVPVSGWLADKYGRRSSQLVITGAIIIFGLSFGFLMDPSLVGTGEDANTGRIVLFMAIGMTLMGLTFGSMSAYLPELFPTNVRYTASGISYNVASILGAALTPYAAVWLNANGGVGAVGLYLAGAGLLTLIFMAITHETRDVDLTTMARAK